jgi:hypothetical protein
MRVRPQKIVRLSNHRAAALVGTSWRTVVTIGGGIPSKEVISREDLEKVWVLPGRIVNADELREVIAVLNDNDDKLVEVLVRQTWENLFAAATAPRGRSRVAQRMWNQALKYAAVRYAAAISGEQVMPAVSVKGGRI